VHRIAPLRRIELDANGGVTCGEDCRCVFPSLCALAAGQGGQRVQPIERRRTSGGVGVRAPVNDVPGVGDVSAERLEAAGITDSLALSRLTEDTLVEVLSTPGGRAFPRARAAEILREARELSGQP
jgi:hypothetical protein